MAEPAVTSHRPAAAGHPQSEVTFLTPSLPGRRCMLDEAARSVRRQTVACRHLWRVDTDRQGPAPIRNALLDDVDTKFAGYLDDDDVLYPRHAEVCLAALRDTGACVVYPWFRFVHPAGIYPHGEFLRIHRAGGPVHAFGQPFDAAGLEHASFIPVTVVARTACLREVGGFPLPGSPEWPHDTCEEWGLWRRLVAGGHRFVHVPRVTWEYRVHGGNTSGRRTADANQERNPAVGEASNGRVQVGSIWSANKRRSVVIDVVRDAAGLRAVMRDIVGGVVSDRPKRVAVRNGQLLGWVFETQAPTLTCVDETAARSAVEFLAHRGVAEAFAAGCVVTAPITQSTVLEFANDALTNGWANEAECDRMISRTVGWL